MAVFNLFLTRSMLEFFIRKIMGQNTAITKASTVFSLVDFIGFSTPR